MVELTRNAVAEEYERLKQQNEERRGNRIVDIVGDPPPITSPSERISDCAYEPESRLSRAIEEAIKFLNGATYRFGDTRFEDIARELRTAYADARFPSESAQSHTRREMAMIRDAARGQEERCRCSVCVPRESEPALASGRADDLAALERVAKAAYNLEFRCEGSHAEEFSDAWDALPDSLRERLIRDTDEKERCDG